VEINGTFYTGDDVCSKKKDAEHSAAHKAHDDLIQQETQPLVDDDPNRHMPPEYADIEAFFVTLIGAYDGRIRKVRPPGQYRTFRLEITGNYRYCDNIKRHHLKNQIYFLVDTTRRSYTQRCYDPECDGFQSAKKSILTNDTQSVEPPSESLDEPPANDR
jgi:hypothetical protein